MPILLILLLGLSGCFEQNLGADKPWEMHWIEDKSGAMTFDEIREKDLSSQWNVTSDNNLNLGFTHSTVWVSLPFDNINEIPTSTLLEVAFPLHDSIDVYLLDGAEVVKSFHTGDQTPFASRPVEHRNFLFPYTLTPHETLRALVRVKTTDTMYLPMKVWESNEFFAQDQNQILLLGLFFGFLTIMMTYNLLLYFSTRHQRYLFYVLYTASIIYLQLSQKGMGYQYFWAENQLFNHLSVPLANYVVMASSLLFILNFLDLDQRQNAKTIKTFKSLIGLSLLGFVSIAVIITSKNYIVSYQTLLMSTVVLGMASTVIVMGVLLRLSLQRNHSAQLLFMAWISLFVGILLFALGRVGLPMPMWLSENAMLMGSTFEAALISFALARHIKQERDARMLAQQSALNNERETREAQNSLLALEKKTTEQLEQEVKERTQKLEKAMQSLTAANHKLDNLARLDSLTGLSNRWNFDQKFDVAWYDNKKQQQPMSLLMADIDHFKKINDTYGHLFGDQCLMQVAKILKQCVKHPDNLAARFGGEEFIIMLPKTDAKKAELVAERIRHNIEKLRLVYEGKQIHFTISIGVATVIPSGDTCGAALNESADQALYQAKEGGRNRVESIDYSAAEIY